MNREAQHQHQHPTKGHDDNILLVGHYQIYVCERTNSVCNYCFIWLPCVMAYAIYMQYTRTCSVPWPYSPSRSAEEMNPIPACGCHLMPPCAGAHTKWNSMSISMHWNWIFDMYVDVYAWSAIDSTERETPTCAWVCLCCWRDISLRSSYSPHKALNWPPTNVKRQTNCWEW